MLDKIINKHLERQGFMKVPKSWANDYKSLGDKHLEMTHIVREIGTQYNELLREFAEISDNKYLISILEEIKIDVTGIKRDREKLINLYVEAFSITFEDDIEEEII